MTRVGIGSARIGPVCALPALLRQFRLDPAGVIRGAGLDPWVFENPNVNMTYRDFCRLLKACVAATGCGHFGLLLGQRAGLAELGNVAVLARHAPDVMTALRDFETYLHVFDRACAVSLVVDGDTAILSYTIIAPDLVATDQMYDMCLSITFNVAKELCGPGFRPSAVMLPHRPPPDPRIFKRFFKTAVLFDADLAALAFPATWLKQPPQCSNPALREAYLRAVVALAAVTDQSVSERVRGLLCAGLSRRQCDETEVAAHMSIDVSTLRRRLQREGTSFRQIVAETRYEMAKHFLLHSHVSLDRLSALLGYSEHSAFSRAFRAWAGMAPKAWQAREHSGPALADDPSPPVLRTRSHDSSATLWVFHCTFTPISIDLREIMPKRGTPDDQTGAAPLFPDQAVLTRIRLDRNEWRFYRMEVCLTCSAAPCYCAIRAASAPKAAAGLRPP